MLSLILFLVFLSLIYLWIYFGAVQMVRQRVKNAKFNNHACGMKNCMAQCQGLCDASGAYSTFCDPPSGVCKGLNWRSGVSNSLS